MKANSTHTVNQDVNPVYHDWDLPVLRLMTSDRERIANTHLVISVQDEDTGSCDDDMGCCTVRLGDVLEEEDQILLFDRDIYCNGVRQGSLSGKIQIKWPLEDGTRLKKKPRKKGPRTCSVM